MNAKEITKALRCSSAPDEADGMGCANKRCRYRDVDGACDIVSMCGNAVDLIENLQVQLVSARNEAEGMRTNWYKCIESLKESQRRAEPCEIAQYADNCESCGFCAQPENEPLTCKNCIQFMEWNNPTEYDGDCRIRMFYSVMREYQCVKKTDFCSFGERKPERSEG